MHTIYGDFMKSPFHYQMSERSSLPTTYCNLLLYLFKREEIPNILIQRIYQYAFDLSFSKEIASGGSSRVAHLLLVHFLQDYAKNFSFPLSGEMIYGAKVDLKLFQTVLLHGIIVTKVCFEERDHYVLVTRIDREFVYLFDPYYTVNEKELDEVWYFNDRFFDYNRKIKVPYFFQTDSHFFTLGEISRRECALFYRIHHFPV